MRYITLLTFLFFTSIAFSQNKAEEVISAMQAGRATMLNGNAIIKLNESVTQAFLNKSDTSAAYYVAITPLCNCGQFYISEKNKDSFTIKVSGAVNGSDSFDYIVYVKQTAIITLPAYNYNMRSPAATPTK